MITLRAVAFAANIYIITSEQHGMMDLYEVLMGTSPMLGPDPSRRVRRLSKLSALSFQVGVAILVL
jgi:hypothetical protein